MAQREFISHLLLFEGRVAEVYKDVLSQDDMATSMVKVIEGTLSATTNDYDNDETSGALVLYLRLATSGGAQSMTGVDSTSFPNAILLFIQNTNPAMGDAITIEHADAGSTAGNRFYSETGLDVSLGAAGAMLFVRDTLNLRWAHLST